MLLALGVAACGAGRFDDAGLGAEELTHDGGRVPPVTADGGCPAPQQACRGRCADLSSDTLDCGACGNACGTGELCMAGQCVPPCAPPRTGCVCGMGRSLCGAACVDTQTDARNCGACGHACDPGGACAEGACLPPCATGQTRCDAACVDTQTDEQNCGACGSVCASGDVCTAGHCVTPPSCGLAEAAACTPGHAAPDCCADGRRCASYTTGGRTYCCRNAGGACTMNSGCCGDLVCTDGTCQPRPVCSLGEAAACTPGHGAPDCCSSGRRCAPYTSGGSTYCCRDAGGACTTSLGCCGLLLCRSGVCR